MLGRDLPTTGTQIPKQTLAYSRISSNGEGTRLRTESESDDFSGLLAVGRYFQNVSLTRAL